MSTETTLPTIDHMDTLPDFSTNYIESELRHTVDLKTMRAIDHFDLCELRNFCLSRLTNEPDRPLIRWLHLILTGELVARTGSEIESCSYPFPDWASSELADCLCDAVLFSPFRKRAMVNLLDSIAVVLAVRCGSELRTMAEAKI